MYGVRRISSTIEFSPEQCTVPAGISEVVVLARREHVDVFLGVERMLAVGRCAQVGEHLCGSDARLQTEVDDSVVGRVEHVVALVLGVGHAERVADVLRQRVHLQREVAAAHRVEEVESDREFGAEARERALAEELPRMAEDEIDRRDLDHAAAGLEQQRVLLRHAVEAPRVVVRRSGRGRECSSSTARPTRRGRRTARRGTGRRSRRQAPHGSPHRALPRRRRARRSRRRADLSGRRACACAGRLCATRRRSRACTCAGRRGHRCSRASCAAPARIRC